MPLPLVRIKTYADKKSSRIDVYATMYIKTTRLTRQVDSFLCSNSRGVLISRRHPLPGSAHLPAAIQQVFVGIHSIGFALHICLKSTFSGSY